MYVTHIREKIGTISCKPHFRRYCSKRGSKKATTPRGRRHQSNPVSCCSRIVIFCIMLISSAALFTKAKDWNSMMYVDAEYYHRLNSSHNPPTQVLLYNFFEDSTVPMSFWRVILKDIQHENVPEFDAGRHSSVCREARRNVTSALFSPS